VVPTDDGFLNVDLEVGARTRVHLGPLSEALQGKLVELFRGRLRGLYRAHYQSVMCRADASAAIHELAAVIEALKPPARRAWNTAVMRDFNIGVELARGVRSIELVIEPDAICRVAALGGRIAFTAYQAAAMPRQRRDRGIRRIDQEAGQPTRRASLARRSR
jgi:hypothetical protein